MDCMRGTVVGGDRHVPADRALARDRGQLQGHGRAKAPAQDKVRIPELEPHAAYVPPQLMEPGPAQPPPEPATAPNL